jgi:maltooligosyltrehalose trehalohydrolase
VSSSTVRRYPVGAEVKSGGVHFRVWSTRRSVSVVVGGEEHSLGATDAGYFETFVEGAAPGARYGFRLDGGDRIFPDPASRWQPDGIHELSAVVDPSSYRWADEGWPGVNASDAVIYEMHVGTFTPEGTWRSAEQHLPHLREVGITILEVMPVAEFPGRFGWGYDGVDLWAPSRLYGTPDDFRHFVDAAHQQEIGVILDVVYNHLGPEGNYLKEFSPDFFTDRYATDWGEALNFDGERAAPVREFFVSNAAFWIDEYHLDGLRMDATQSIFDTSDEHLLAAISRRAREVAGDRSLFIVAENEPQNISTVIPVEQGGFGLDAMWNDDFHHSARVALTGKIDGYFHDYRGMPQEFVSMAKHGFLYQGQWYSWQKNNRGTPSLGWPPATFVWYLQNHDQIANSGFGHRLAQITDPSSLRAMTALLLLGPAIPMLFQGQEFASSSPFLYFADHDSELAALVEKGRKDFLRQFAALATEEVRDLLPPPHEPEVFRRCVIDWSDRERHGAVLEMHRDLLRLRREVAPFADRALDGAVLAERTFVLRSLPSAGEGHLLIVNLGEDLRLEPVAEPLLAPPAGMIWHLLWSSESPRYDGGGTPPVWLGGAWAIPARSALLFAPGPPERGEEVS